MGYAAQPSNNRLARYPYAVDYTAQLTDFSSEPVAKGGFSNVYRCRLNGKLVAVKRLVASAEYPPLTEMAQREYDHWCRLRHPRILTLEGICFISSDSMIPSFISRWQKNGRIKDFVVDKPEADFLCLIEDIADGLNYLHENDVIHGDLRAANVLISNDHRALVTDFGIAKYDNGDGIPVSKELQGNFRWMAHEFFNSETGVLPAPGARRSRASDVWMFGIVVQEVLSGKVPYYEYKNIMTIACMIGKGELPVFPAAQHTAWQKFNGPMRKLFLRCCALQPEMRPSIASLLTEIRKV